MGTTQKSTHLINMLSGMAAMMGGFNPLQLATNHTPQFRMGTYQRKGRKKGPVRPAGSKQARATRKHKLGLCNPGGTVSAYFRESKQERMLQIQAEHGYGNCAGKLH